MPWYPEYGMAVRAIRQRLGYSQRGAARLCGYAPQTIASWERGNWPSRRASARIRVYLAALWHNAIMAGVPVESTRREMFPDLYSEV